MYKYAYALLYAMLFTVSGKLFSTCPLLLLTIKLVTSCNECTELVD
jgi:hypothetical protein